MWHVCVACDEPAADTKKVTQDDVDIVSHAVHATVVGDDGSPDGVHFNCNDVAASATQVHSDSADACRRVDYNAGRAGSCMMGANFLRGNHEIPRDVAEHASVGRACG
jgi:hypothetical protein